MKWQSEEHVRLAEAAEWARHFGQLENEMDALLAEMFGISGSEMQKWINPGRYITGRELASAGLAEMLELKAPVGAVHNNGDAAGRKRARATGRAN
jgi:hypothetical protein